MGIYNLLFSQMILHVTIKHIQLNEKIDENATAFKLSNILR